MTPDPDATFEGHPIEWKLPNQRSTVMHAFVKGAGTGDMSLCGVELRPEPVAEFVNDPACTRCLFKLDPPMPEPEAAALTTAPVHEVVEVYNDGVRRRVSCSCGWDTGARERSMSFVIQRYGEHLMTSTKPRLALSDDDRVALRSLMGGWGPDSTPVRVLRRIIDWIDQPKDAR